MSNRIPAAQQILAIDTACAWLRAAGTAYLSKTLGVRPSELNHVQDGLAAAAISLEWLAVNRPAFEAWLAAKAEGVKQGGESI